MTNHPIFFDDQYEISYEDGVHSDPQYIGFWLRQKSEGSKIFGPPIPITPSPDVPPLNIEIDGKEISVVEKGGKPVLYWRIYDDHKEYHYNRYDTENFQSRGLAVSAIRRGAFDWHNVRNQKPDFKPDSNSFIVTSLSRQQKGYLIHALTAGNSVTPEILWELKTSCTALQEYQACIEYLLGYQQTYPRNLTSKTYEALKRLEANYLTPEGLHKHQLNGRRIGYNGHMATLGEARDYVRAILKKELESTNPNFVSPDLTTVRKESTVVKAQWNQLAWPGEDLASRPTYTPIYQRKESLEFHQELTENIQAIVAVHQYEAKPQHPPEVKKNASLKELEAASHALQKLLAPKVLNDHAHVFVGVMSGVSPLQPANWLRVSFLLPLYQAVQEKIRQIRREQAIADQLEGKLKPRNEQFKALRVDEWDGVAREAIRADFLNEQFNNPHGIFLNLDQDSANPLTTPGNDLRVINLPIGNDPNADILVTKAKIKQFFAQEVYPQIRLGATIIVPCVKDKDQQTVPQFGTGSFADSNFVATLRPFVLEEIQKIQAFCVGDILPHQLEGEYFTAWLEADESLPLPRLSAPQEVIPPPPPGIEANNLISAGFRARLEELVGDKLGEHTDKITKERTFHGTLPNGVEFELHKNRMVIPNDVAKRLSPEAYREAMGKLLDLYIEAYKPGKPPSVTPIGRYRHTVITELLKEKGIPIHKDAPAPKPPRPGNTRPPSAAPTVV